MIPAIFLDRDGVLIENRPNYVRSWADVAIYPQALQALAQIRDIPHKIILVTNQSVVGRGLISLAAAQAINDRIVETVRRGNGRIDAVYMCPHTPEDQCTCRKPQPGLLLQAAADHNIALGRSIMIGDALTDIAAGQAVGAAQTILLRTGRGADQARLPQTAQLAPFAIFNTLADALVHHFGHF